MYFFRMYGCTCITIYITVLESRLFLVKELTWNPDFMLATEHLEPQVSHCKKKSRVSFWRIVSGERHVWHVTYSLIYLLRTFSICFCWKRPLIISWLLPSTEPLVPNSASKKSSKCFGCLCNVLQICKRNISKICLLFFYICTIKLLLKNYYIIW